MTILRSLGAVASARSDRGVDWAAAVDAARASTAAGSLDVSRGDRAGFARDVAAASEGIGDLTGLSVSTPDAVELQHRHHWIETNAATFRRVLAPIETTPALLPGLVGRANTATAATLLAVLGRAVIGQYDPGLFGNRDPRLSIVLPNLREATGTLDVDAERFRRWVVFHEVAHAAEFEAAPWLREHVEERVERAVVALADGDLDRTAIRDVDATMTAVEGYAEFVMDRAFDDQSDDLRAALDARRRGGGPLRLLVRHLLGLGAKRRQYERGRRFFEFVADERGAPATGAVWREPGSLPTDRELTRPARWLARVDP